MKMELNVINQIAEELKYEDERIESVEVKKITKNNEEEKIGLILRTRDNIHPTIYIEQIIEHCLKKNYDEDEIKEVIIKQAKLALDETPNLKMDEIWTENYITENVVPRIVNYEKNKKRIMENDLLFTTIEDLAILYYVEVMEKGAFALTWKHMKSLMLSLGEIEQKAYENLEKKEIDIIPLNDMIEELTGDTIFSDIPKIKAFVIGNKKEMNASNRILRKDIAEHIEEVYEENHILLPSSIHEWILYTGKEIDANQFRQMVKDVNRTQVDNEDFLSNNVYKIKKGELKIIE